MDKAYNHLDHEKNIYKKWEESGAFKPNENKRAFSIIMPPPNANDPLHVGHAMFVALEDILIRYHRMNGEAALWLPGTDHAGIETQYVFEKKLAKQDKSRFDFDRETLYKMIWDYVEENSGIAVEQMKRLGASADWSRFTFTLDPKVVEQVLATFEKLYKDGLVYRGERLVNYCTKCGTGYSELEVDYEERNDPMYFMKYGPFVIATARPETKFRDTALAVNPTDKRYKDYLGKTVEVTGLLGSISMTIVADEEVDPEFGTGIMKVTPAHDPHDFELGKKYNLPVTPIIDFNGRMDFSWYLNDPDFQNKPEKYKARAAAYHGKKVAEARKLMAADLIEDGLIDHVDEKYVHRVGVCYRCKTVIEPLPLPQFFISVRGMADKAISALDSGETKILGAGRDKILRDWLINLRDWNISRQVTWGIRMPIWYDVNKTPDLRVISLIDGEKIKGKISELSQYSFEQISNGLQSVQAPKEAEYVVSITKPGDGYLQETDTFDTWFSSGQWPVVTLKSTQEGDFEKFYPTTVMETAYDILPFWVMRMMLLGIYMTGKSPFEYVYLHGLVRDEKGQKMSKSKGNVINPVDMIEKYGADSIRMALVMSSTPGQDKSVGETVIKGMRNFSNKIWNSARFVSMLEVENASGAGDDKFRQRLATAVATVTSQMDEMRVGQAAETAYSEFWHWFCDEAIEKAKTGEISKKAIEEGLETFLRLLHPFAPFVTETVWNEIGKKDLLITNSWPTP